MRRINSALWRRGFPRNIIFHSDTGSQYCSDDLQKLLKSHGIVSSMSRKGNCWNNSVAESFFNSIKTELIHDEQYVNREMAKQSIFEYIKIYYNRIRRHSAIGLIAPMCLKINLKKWHNGAFINLGKD